MKITIIFLLSFLGSILFSQIEMNYSYEMQYGDGKEVFGQASNNPQKRDYSYFQNILDINTYFGENIYVFTQLEYSNPPIYGYDRLNLDSLIASLYFEFSNEKFNMKIGNLYELYGRGLGYYSFQDQNVDYDNSIQGLSLSYYLNEKLQLSTLIGSGVNAFRSNPANRKTDYQFDMNVGLGAIDYEHSIFGYFQTVFLTQQANFSGNLIENLCLDDNELGDALKETALFMNDFGACGPFEEKADKININNYNLNWNYFLGPFDVYIDKSWIFHDKIHGDEVFGSRFYASIYAELFGIGITYEYKNYHTPYLLKSVSNPPIVYREGNSMLASRNSHSMNFGNEIGHQLDINRNLTENMNFFANISMSFRHENDNMQSFDFMDVLSMKEQQAVQDYFPFRQIYVEINGWTFSDQLYYKIGLDQFMEFIDIKDVVALTMPTQTVLEFKNGSSLTMYLEAQEKTVKELGSEFHYDNQYASLSYSHHGKWIMTGFFDQEIKDGKSKQWLGADLSWKINTKTMVSLFHGSQKGGLVCANGICAEQPGFENGLKLTFRTLY